MGRTGKLFLFVVCIAALVMIVLYFSGDRQTADSKGTSGGGAGGGDAAVEASPGGPRFGGTVSFLSRKDPQTLNNVIHSDGPSRRISSFIFPPLIDLDPETKALRPLTAAILPEIAAGNLVHRWRLREGLKWHDFEESGAYLTTRDVKFSFDLIWNEKIDAAHVKEALGGLEEIRVVDDLTFETVYSEPYFSSAYTFGRRMRIMPAHLLEGVPAEEINRHPLGRNPIGYGPFRFGRWETGREVVLERSDLNRDIFPEFARPWMDRIRWKIVADKSMEYLLFKKGELDIFNMVHDDVEAKAGTEDFKKVGTVHTYYIPYFNYIGWNNRSDFFENRLTRQAMAHLIRRHQILESHLYGKGKVLSGPFYYFSNEYDRSIEPRPFDPDRARTLLADAGWSDSDGNGILDKEFDGERKEFRFEILLSTNMFPYEMALYRRFEEDLKTVGIIMVQRRLEWNTRRALITDQKFDAYQLGATADLLYEDYYMAWHSSQTVVPLRNRVGFVNARVDEILEQARIEVEDAKRYALMRELHAILHEDQPVTALYTPAVNAAVSNRMQNVRVYDGQGVYVYDWWLSEN